MRLASRFGSYSTPATTRKRKGFTLSVIGGILLMLTVPATALADTTGGSGPGAAFSNGMTITITGATQVANGILVNINVTIRCDPLSGTSNGFDPSLGAWAQQAVKNRIAFGQSSVGVALVCDGADHRFVAQVAADPTGVPFARGWATVAATAQVCLFDPNFGYQCRSAGTGWVVVKFRR